MRKKKIRWGDVVKIYMISNNKDRAHRKGERDVPFGDSDALREWIKDLLKRTRSKSKTHKRLQERYR
jgi:hypothetical protein